MIRVYNLWKYRDMHTEQIVGNYGVGVYGSYMALNSKVDAILGMTILTTPTVPTPKKVHLYAEAVAPAINNLLFKVAYVFLHTTEQGE